MEDYNDRREIRRVWKDGYADVVWGGVYPHLYVLQGGSSGSNLNTSTEVGSYGAGGTGPIHGGYQAMVLHYENDGSTYTGLPGEAISQLSISAHKASYSLSLTAVP